jgi:hypothetical protein
MFPDCAGFVQNLVQLSGHRLKVVLRQVRVRPQHSLRLPTSGLGSGVAFSRAIASAMNGSQKRRATKKGTNA